MIKRFVQLLLIAALLPAAARDARAAEPSPVPDTPIPRQGLALWLTAAGAVVENGKVTSIKDFSGNQNDAVLQKDPKIAAGNPVVVKHEEAGQPVLRFNGSFTGYEFNSLKNARTVFYVVSKHPAAFKKFAERFVLGGKDKTSVDYHVGAHWTDTLIELGMFKHGKVWFNGFPIDPALSEFAPKLAVISFAAGRDTIAGLLARDRDFTDRSWHGDIGEVIVYTASLSDADRQAVEQYLMKKYSITPFKPAVVTRESVLPGHTNPPAGDAKSVSTTLVNAEPSLVPAAPSTAPDYFCTWNVQGFACGYAGPSPQADMMVEASLFGQGPNQDWLGFYPEVRADLTFLLDDAFDFPLGGGHSCPLRGSVELDPGRFPSYRGTPAERLAKLSRDVRAKGWRDLGLWICNSRPNVDSLPIDSDTYWCERLAWSQQAGIGNWKVDWGIGMPGKPLWKFKVTPKARSVAPDVWIEFGAQGDLYRTYDVNISVSIPETIRRIAVFLARPDPEDHRLINCEDEVYIGAGTGCSYGVMRHPLNGNMPNGKPDPFFPSHFRDVKHRIDEVTRAVRWHRIALPFGKGDKAAIDDNTLSDFKSKPAPARIARGGLPLPTVTVPDGKEPPYVLCCRHPDGEIAVATVPRNLDANGRANITFPLADVTLDAGELNRPVGIFGEYASLTLVTTSTLAGKRILAQDLAGQTPVDITGEVKVDGGRLTIPGAVIHRVGLMAAKPGDVSDPGLVLAVEGLTKFVPKQPMKPGKNPDRPKPATEAEPAAKGVER
ncbi:MAG: hypothetical protein NT049_13275 [Planctomycetota bacterium]|nr:hypothetical protein [Planctomycetota bacterium]